MSSRNFNENTKKRSRDANNSSSTAECSVGDEEALAALLQGAQKHAQPSSSSSSSSQKQKRDTYVCCTYARPSATHVFL